MRYRRTIEFDAPEPTAPIGVIVPFDFNLDWEYWRYLPPGVALHFTRTPATRAEVGVGLAHAVGRRSVVAGAARALGAVGPRAMLYACSSGSFVDGIAGERTIREAMADAVGAPAVTTAGATLDALHTTGMRRVAVATPYTARLTARLADFLAEDGFEVVSAHHLGLARDISRVSTATIRDLVRQADDTDADAVVLSCTALRTWGVVHELEGELGRPVFTSNQLSLWGVLRAAGVLAGGMGQPGSGWTMGGEVPSRSTRLLLAAGVSPVAAGAAA